VKKFSLIGTISLASARVLMPYKTPSEDGVAFFRTDTVPSQVRVGVWRPVARNRDGITGCCPWATRSAAQAKNPPPVECKLLITKHLMVKSGGVISSVLAKNDPFALIKRNTIWRSASVCQHHHPRRRRVSPLFHEGGSQWGPIKTPASS
jgi:hypothetical protein